MSNNINKKAFVEKIFQKLEKDFKEKKSINPPTPFNVFKDHNINFANIKKKLDEL